jgi:hypothetical protein
MMLKYKAQCGALFLMVMSLGCFDSLEQAPLRHEIPKGYLARFEGIQFKQVNYEQRRWVSGEAKVLNAHPFKLKFDLVQPQGTVWLDNGNETRDFSIGSLRLRGQQHRAHLLNTSVIGLGAGKWLRLKQSALDQNNLSLTTLKEAWMISPNTWLRAPRGLTADLQKGEVEAVGPVRLEAFSPSAFQSPGVKAP